MSLTDIKTKSQGFTIVELLIVVVVIAILAAITIVSYNGITNRANASAAKSTAATWQKKIELYQAEEGAYPYALSSLTADSDDAFYIAPTTPLASSLTSSNGKTTVIVQPCRNASTAPANQGETTGTRITYYNYEDTSGNKVINIGSVGTSGTPCATAWANP